MADVFSRSKRSEIMSAVRATETKPEIQVRNFLFNKGFRFRKNVKSLTGSPDIVLSKYKTILFINGCFWHGHKNCEGATLPKSNKKYWTNKIAKNIERDKRNQKELKRIGWKVIVIWECQIKNKKEREKTLNKLLKKLKA